MAPISDRAESTTIWFLPSRARAKGTPSTEAAPKTEIPPKRGMITAMVRSISEAGMERAPTTMPPRMPVSVMTSISIPTPKRIPTTLRMSETPSRTTFQGANFLPTKQARTVPITKVRGSIRSGNHFGKVLGPTIRMITTSRGM